MLRVRSLVFAVLLWEAPGLACAATPDPSIAASVGAFETVRSHADIDVNADGSFVEAAETGLRVLDSRGQKALQQVTLDYTEGLQSLAVVSAYTLKANGEKIAVPEDQMLRGFGATSAPGFEDLKTVTIVFPKLDIGDEVFLTTLRRQIVPLFAGAFTLRKDLSRAAKAQDVQVTLTAPREGLPLQIEAVGLEGGERQEFAGKYRWVWKFHNDAPVNYGADAVIAADDQPHLIASSFASYGVVGKSYGEHFAGKADVTPDIQALADQLTRGIADRRAQAKALYDWVATHISYVNIVLGAGGFTPHAASQVLATHYGDCKDHVMMLEALLAAKGIASNPALIAAGGPYVISRVPSAFYFNHVITYIPEFRLYADSTARYAPFGMLPFHDADRPVVLVPDGEVSHTPNLSADESTARSDVKVKFDVAGAADGVSHYSLTGDAAFAGRVLLESLPPEQEKDVFRLGLGPGADATIDRGNVQSLDDLFSYSIRYNVPGAVAFPGPGAVSGSVTLGAFGPGPALLGTLPPSHITAFACPSETVEETDSYEFPAGIQISSVPPATDVVAEGLQFHMRYVVEGTHSVVASRTLRVDHPHAWCTPDYYARVRPDLARIATSLRGQVLYK